MKKNQFTNVNWFFYIGLMDEIVVCSLRGTERPECLDALAAAEVHFGNEDGTIRIDSFDYADVSHPPCIVRPCMSLDDCTDGRAVVYSIACRSCMACPVGRVAPVVTDRFAELLAALECIPCAVAPVIPVRAI